MSLQKDADRNEENKSSIPRPICPSDSLFRNEDRYRVSPGVDTLESCDDSSFV